MARPLLDPPMLRRAMIEAFYKLDPRIQIKNPLVFICGVGSVVTTALFFQDLFSQNADSHWWWALSITVWLWFTQLFSNFSEAIAELRGKAQADSLRKTRRDIMAFVCSEPHHGSGTTQVSASKLKAGDAVLVKAGDIIPGDGTVVEGVASVDESTITGESAPVIRESGSDRSHVTGGTRVLSDWLIVRITANQGEAFLDRMITLVEGAKRQRTPNEIALTVFLVAQTITYLLACMTLLPFSLYAAWQSSTGTGGAGGTVVSVAALVTLFVSLAPTTIGGLMSAIGIAGMDRLIQANVIATSGRAVEIAGDVDVLLLDKTGTITMGNREATAFMTAPGVHIPELSDAAQLSSLADETPEGRSIVVLAKESYGLRGRDLSDLKARFIPFSAQTRMSGVDLQGREIRKGAAHAIEAYVKANKGVYPTEVRDNVDMVSRQGGTPLVVAERGRVLGVVHLKDVVKGGIKERFAELRRMGIKTVMITGDNPLTAAAIAAEAGVDDFLAEATPERKLALIQKYQAEGKLVAMTGDGANDAPALAQADVAVAMNSGSQAAREACNMVDLDSNPTKLIEIVKIGKQMLMTRGSLTTFSMTNDVAKYFAIIPAAFSVNYPELDRLDIMNLASPESAILSCVIFNALAIMLLIPLALRGVSYRPGNTDDILRRNLWVYGLAGLIMPFVGIKLIDLLLELIGLGGRV
jgi:potassium-transporting ATPase ATP-binding subunit